MLEANARAWMAADPDPATREETQALLDLGDTPGLADRFGSQLQFGTAGMRGALGPGPNRMNRAQVRRISAALGDILTKQDVPGKGVVVGRDHRHMSAEFAADTAMVLAGAGLFVMTWPDKVPTPLVAWATRKLNAQAGVMITASHNPPADNGYKLYWHGGAQIIPPVDAMVTEGMEAIENLNAIPMGEEGSQLIKAVDPQIRADYIDAVLGLLPPTDRARGANLRIAYTPLHGVGKETLEEIFTRAGFTDLHVVPEQAEPDPNFPTVEFPNPEEPGAMDMVLALAEQIDADLVLANDPDADRICAAIPTPNGWVVLGGDEIGTMLAEDILANRISGPHTLNGDREPLVATTVVSSQLLAKIAASYDVAYAETLTGFKWMAEAARQGEANGQHMVLAYEQALGVSVADVVRDKDGISAALMIADLAERAKLDGIGLNGILNQMAITYGAHVLVEDNVELEAGADFVQKALDGLRANWPKEIEGSPVIAIADHDAGVTTHADGSVEPIDLPPTKLIRLSCEDGSRVMVRPSGTEPKLKFYAEAVEPVEGGQAGAARKRAHIRAQEILQDFIAVTMARAGVSAA
ncbi:phospho-sugar mutase [Stomatohabitans albus]|uniref:phospho-sugar mutase n=1 Tax=Stomatohabitans albus TaxID=3110766 RepID=UPI00300CD410